MRIKSYFLKKFNIITFYLFSSLFFFTGIPNNITSIILIAYVTVSLLYLLLKEHRINVKFSLKTIAINLAFILIIILTLTYSTNINYGIRRINTLLPLLILPIITAFLQPKYTKKQIQSIAWVFIVSNLVFIIYLLIYLINFSVESCYPDIGALSFFQKITYLNGEPYTKLLWCSENTYEPKILIHKTYNSIGFLLSLLGCIYLLKKGAIIQKLFMMFLITVFSLALIYLKSLIGIALLFTLIPIIGLRYLTKSRKAILIYALFMVILFFVFQKSMKVYVSNQYDRAYTKINNKDLNGISERIDLSIAASELFKKSPLIGYGIGDVQDKLNEEYLNRSTDRVFASFFEKKLNTHNYYSNLLLVGGPFLLLVFIVSIIYNIHISFKVKNIFFLAFVIIIVLNLSIENLFDRMNGVMTYSLGISLLINQLLPQKN